MRKTLIVLLASAWAVTPSLSAPERFTADKPSPLKRVKPARENENPVRFGGSVRLAGQFLVVWQRIDGKPVYHQVTFYPDQASAALLPHAAETAPVSELTFTNREQAGRMLLDLPTVQKALERDQIGSEGAATVTIRDYQAVVECDQRYYLAQLVSVRKAASLLVSAREAHPGC